MQLPLGLQLRDSARLDNFFVGENKECVQSVDALATASGEHFIYVYGRLGVGKTHLLQGACRVAQGKGLRAVYLPLGMRGMEPGMCEALEQFDLICLDDMQTISGEPAWEQALFHLYNRVRDGGGYLLVAAEQAPDNLALQLPDLQSRLTWGPVYQLRPLADAALPEALTERARARGLELPDETVEFLLRRYTRDFAALCELLDRLDLASLAAQRRLTVPFVKTVLEMTPAQSD